MPGFPQLTPKDQEMLLQFLTHKMAKNNTQEIQDKTEETQLPFQHTGYNKFLDKNGLPAIAPPWGTLQALDLNTGKYLWKVPLAKQIPCEISVILQREPKTTEGQLSPKTDYSLLPLQRMVTSGHSTRKPEAYSGNLNYSLPPLQPQQCIKLKANSIWQLLRRRKNGN